MADWLEILIRSVFFLVILFVITKLIGKRQISQLSFFEYVAGITIGSVAAEISVNRDKPVDEGIIAMVVWGIIPLAAGYIAMKSKKLRGVIEGNATVFIKDGKVLEENLKKEKYTIDEMLSLLRSKGVFFLSDVEYAVLEQDGSLNVLLKKDKRPLTRSDLQLLPINEKEPHTIIMDGKLLNEDLSKSGKTKAWLDEELEAAGVTIENVFLGQVNSYGELYLDLYDDQLQVSASQERPLLLATLKKSVADLESFALATDSQEAKNMYEQNAKKLQKLIKQTEMYLQS